MFGNGKGWIISAGIVVLMALIIFAFGRPPQITPPTRKFPQALAPSALKTDPAGLGIKPGGNDCDANDLYTRVIDEYNAHHFTYDKYNTDPALLVKEKPQIVQWVVEAADCNKATMFSKKPAEIVNYANREDSLDAFKAAGGWANVTGLYLIKQKTPKYDEAERYLRGAFMLGLRLYNERMRWEEYTDGTELMTKAAYAMAAAAKAQHYDDRAAQLQAFENEVDTYQHGVLPLWQAISGIAGNPLNNAGDMFDIAQNSPDPMWRTEATLKLGRMVYMDTVTAADQRGALRVLKQMSERTDLPLPVKAAVAAAKNLTVEDFRKFGGGS